MPDLTGKRILITRPRSQLGPFIELLKEAGAIPVPFPVIEISPIEDTILLDRALKKLACYDWLVLTSVNGVDAVWQRLAACEIAHLPDELQVAAIGPKTAQALRDRGVRVDFVPDEYVAEAILPGLGELRGRWVLLPRADQARRDLALAIAADGGVPHEIAAYRTIPAPLDPDGLAALQAGVDALTFTSSSTVRNFIRLTREAGLDPFHLPGNPIIACIGPITAASAREAGFPVDVVADEYTTGGLLKAMTGRLRSTR
jgi:uroporphyrinogen-III synthase